MANEYNSLGQILSSGGEVALAKAIASGWSSERIGNLMLNRLRVQPGDEENVLRQFGEAMVSAGDTINGLNESDGIPNDAIPTNPYGFGPDGEGGRYRYSAEFSIDGGANWFQVQVVIGDSQSVAEVLDAIRRQAAENIGHSPGAFGTEDDIKFSDISAIVTGIEKAY